MPPACWVASCAVRCVCTKETLPEKPWAASLPGKHR